MRIILTNLSNKAKEIETGDRTVQVLFIKKEDVEFEEVNEFDQTERGTNGFGSTGK